MRVSQWTLYNWLSQGRPFKRKKLGGKTYVDSKEIEAWLKNHWENVDYLVDKKQMSDLQRTFTEIIERTGAKTSDGSEQYVGHWPAHDDRSPSLSVSIKKLSPSLNDTRNSLQNYSDSF